MESSPEQKLRQVPAYLAQQRLEEAERLLVAVLREAPRASHTHWEGLITLGELYEKQGRFQEGLIVCREVAEKLSSETALGARGHGLLARLQSLV